ncbi:MAG: cytochrome P450 [Aphanothece sp. CMT-3BRIN-NPC111]|jgi:hypothetical protein|nr:cytochrome P450 [Aphanothece sp. CMT-3BRIN-NPC111]
MVAEAAAWERGDAEGGQVNLFITLFSRDVSEGEPKNVAYALDVTMDEFESKRKQNFIFWEWFPRPENVRYRNAIQEMDKTIYKLYSAQHFSLDALLPYHFYALLQSLAHNIFGKSKFNRLFQLHLFAFICVSLTRTNIFARSPIQNLKYNGW